MFHVKHPAFFVGRGGGEGGGVGIGPYALRGTRGRHAESSCPTGATGVVPSNAGGGAVGAA